FVVGYLFEPADGVVTHVAYRSANEGRHIGQPYGNVSSGETAEDFQHGPVAILFAGRRFNGYLPGPASDDGVRVVSEEGVAGDLLPALNGLEQERERTHS